MKGARKGGKGMGRNRWIKMSTILVSPSVVYSVSCEMCGSNRKSLMEPDPRASSQSQWSIYNSPPLFLFILRILFRQWAFWFPVPWCGRCIVLRTWEKYKMGVYPELMRFWVEKIFAHLNMMSKMSSAVSRRWSSWAIVVWGMKSWIDMLKIRRRVGNS